MAKTSSVSNTTRNNWLIDFGLLISSGIALVSGIYFLYLPTNGYQGGRNPYYGIRILWERATWDDLHMWGGLAMTAIAVIHIIRHWTWIKSMTVKTIRVLVGQYQRLNPRSRFNIIINAVIGLSFTVTALSGLPFLLLDSRSALRGTSLLAFRDALDLVHTWSGIVMGVAFIVHFAIHWKWVTKVTARITGAQNNQPGIRASA